ncbi:MAG: GGDEF domain-containing protein [Pseudoxanthomonas sp.]
MTTDFYALLLSDCALAGVLLVLFWYVARVSSGLRGIALWGVAHLVYTLGASMLDGSAPLLVEAGELRTAYWIANAGGLLASVGIVAIGWAIAQFVGQRGPRRVEIALMAACAAGSLACWAFSGSIDAQGGAMSAAEVAALLLALFHLARLRDAPALLPARLMMIGMAMLIVLYARDLYSALGGFYESNESWVNIDLSTWFLLNFCMLTLSSFRAAETLRHSALLDPLTNALNRRGLEARLRAGPPAAGARGAAVIALDLDRFKSINDRYGHSVGDLVLRRFSDAVRRCIRSDDLFVRIGGEEFVVVSHGASDADTLALAERILVEVGRQEIAPIAPERITVSAGVAVSATDSIDAVMGCADQALYEAKRLGRNRVHHWRSATAG